METCIIKIIDETNIKLLNLDAKTRRQCVETLKFRIPNAFYTRAYQLGRWNGESSFMTIGGDTQLNLLPRIFPIIQNAGYDFIVDDQRIEHNIDFDPIDANYLSNTNWPEGHRLAGQSIILEEHQVATANVLLKNKQGIASSSTGSGKTVLCAVLSKKSEQYGRTIIIVPSKDLVIQTEKDYINIGLDVGVFYGKRKELNKQHTICTWQSLDRLNTNSKNGLSELEIGEFLDGVIMFLVDECHGAAAAAVQKLLSGPFAKTPLRWGLTGTIPKEIHLKTALEAMIGEVLHTVTAVELQDKGFLANCHVSIEQFIDRTEHKAWPDENDYISNDPTILGRTAARIIKMSETGNVFVLTARHASCEKLHQLIPGSVFFHGGKKDKGERQEAYDMMDETSNKVIIATFGIASTGLNIPRINHLVLYSPGKSFVRIIQSIGRGLRKARDKDFVNISIICTSNKWSSRHLSKIKSFLTEAQYPFTHTKIK